MIDLKQIIEWRKDFSDLLKTINNDGYVIDKTPFNYACRWLIQIMYPNAKIIHCKRDARDVGLSCYQQNFTEQYAWSWDLSQIGHYINAYRELMEFWLKTLHLPILDVNYEDVVGEVEASSRNIVEFLEFEWDDRVLDFHSHKGKITTASKWQVREPIYNRSVGRWQKFERQLAPLIETLKSF